VRERKLYIGTERDTWKVRHVLDNAHVSLTVPIAKRIIFAPRGANPGGDDYLFGHGPRL
jgi:hypothetical protein